MGMAFLHGQNGGGSGCTLTVNAQAGATVTISKDGKTKTKTADSSGVAVFKGLATGTWTVTITDGEQTAGKTVEIVADYATSIAFFAATINVAYPAGSTCTATDGTTTLTASDTSGTWACVVPNAGNWTVTATDGTNTKSEAVSITTNGQSETISIVYWDGTLYNAGDEYTQHTGGWVCNESSGTGFTKASVTKESSRIKVSIEPSYGAIIRCTNMIDVTDFSTISVQFTKGSDHYPSGTAIVVLNSLSLDQWSPSDIAASYETGLYAESGTYNLDISGITGKKYVGIKTSVNYNESSNVLYINKVVLS